jgi:hypothetical protein
VTWSACAAAIVVVIDSLPGASTEHVPVTAHAIELATSSPRQAALLTAIGYSESRFLPRIQAGECKSYRKNGRWEHECDGVLKDGVIIYRARSYFQHLELGAARPVWGEMIGLEPVNVETAARVAGKTLERCLNLCKTDAGAASCYARGSCTWVGGYRRGLLAERIRPKLEACQED